MRCLAVLVVLGGVAQAEPMLRFGMAFGVDRNAPSSEEYGPLIAVGARSGPFTGEASYTYLSFLDQYSSIHRVGVALRTDLVRRWHGTDSNALFGELGAARRFGEWRPTGMGDYAAHRQSEVHAGIGFEMSADAAWQLALSVNLARRDPMLGATCRGIACPVAMPESTGLAESVMIEWTWLLGRRPR